MDKEKKRSNYQLFIKCNFPTVTGTFSEKMKKLSLMWNEQKDKK
jgi:hypothetical protein